MCELAENSGLDLKAGDEMPGMSKHGTASPSSGAADKVGRRNSGITSR